jgi:hypothetical protein
MKRLAIIFTILLFSCTSYSQVVNDSLVNNDSTTISNTELQKVFSAIDTLVYQDSLKTVLIRDLELQIRNYEFLSSQDSLLLNYRDRQINILNEEILLYDKRLKKTNKWYNKPWVGFIGGVATITLSSWIVKNVVD